MAGWCLLSVKAEQEQRLRDVLQEIKNTSGLAKRLGRNAWFMEMQSNHKSSDSVEVKRIKDKTIDSIKSHGSMQLCLGQAAIPGLHNITKVFRLRKVEKNGKVRIIKKSVASIMDYLKWEEERVFQSVWELERRIRSGVLLKCHPGH